MGKSAETLKKKVKDKAADKRAMRLARLAFLADLKAGKRAW